MLVSGLAGLINPASIPGELLRRWERNAFLVVLSDHLVDEVVRTLQKPYFQRAISPDIVARAPSALRRRATMIDIVTPVSGIATHPEDDLVLATAVDGRAAYLVTGDAGLLRVASYAGISIVNPRAFLGVLDAADSTTDLP